MRPLSLDRKSKACLISSILVILISIAVFAFRKCFDETVVLLVVVLTPVVLLGLAFVFGQFSQKN
jgi:hypothetical protein